MRHRGVSGWLWFREAEAEVGCVEHEEQNDSVTKTDSHSLKIHICAK